MLLVSVSAPAAIALLGECLLTKSRHFPTFSYFPLFPISPPGPNVTEGNVMVNGKPVCDDNWGIEEVKRLKESKNKSSLNLTSTLNRRLWLAKRLAGIEQREPQSSPRMAPSTKCNKQTKVQKSFLYLSNLICSFAMDNVKCIGNETALDQCLYTEVVSSVSPVYPCFFIMFIHILVHHCLSLQFLFITG